MPGVYGLRTWLDGRVGGWILLADHGELDAVQPAMERVRVRVTLDRHRQRGRVERKRVEKRTRVRVRELVRKGGGGLEKKTNEKGIFRNKSMCEQHEKITHN